MSEPVQLLCGDARTVLNGLSAQSAHCCVTSPSYYGLRDYGCDGQIGLEDTPQLYVSALVALFRGVWRVLRDDGTLWIVIGDSYAQGGSGGASTKSTLKNDGRRLIGARNYEQQLNKASYSRRAPAGLCGKNLLGIPWRVAFALQEDGWVLRQEICWAKSNPMPESVKDRCTRAHETVFMFAKHARYYYDQQAIAEPVGKGAAGSTFTNGKTGHNGLGRVSLLPRQEHATRNRRSVWTVATTPLSSKKFGCAVEHYAAFPPELVRPMVRAGCPPDGVVLDPFMGSGTTGLVAVQEGRRFVGVDLNPDYVELARHRIACAQPPLLHATG